MRPDAGMAGAVAPPPPGVPRQVLAADSDLHDPRLVDAGRAYAPEHDASRSICRSWRMISSLLAGIPSSSWLSRRGMQRLLTRGERRRRIGYKVAGFISERWPTSARNRWPACVGIRNQADGRRRTACFGRAGGLLAGVGLQADRGLPPSMVRRLKQPRVRASALMLVTIGHSSCPVRDRSRVYAASSGSNFIWGAHRSAASSMAARNTSLHRCSSSGVSSSTSDDSS
jgi:hypothetical protein